MRTTASILRSTTATPGPSSNNSSSSSASAAMISIAPDMVVILASLPCAPICLAGLALVARCACPRRPTSITTASSLPPRGLKKKAIDALPVTTAKEGHHLDEQCAICLADLAAGEELRVLPRCGHAFHVACVDAWLHARTTSPSCRAAILDSSSSSSSPPPFLAPGRCRSCRAACDVADSVAASTAAAVRDDESSFLP